MLPARCYMLLVIDSHGVGTWGYYITMALRQMLRHITFAYHYAMV